jgi:hypothetical protein
MAAKHVTFMKMKVKKGKLDELKKLMSNDDDMDRIKDAGFKRMVIGSRKDNETEVWGAVTWDNSENYYKNAQDPKQNAEFEKMRALLDADPEWFDCDVLDEQD